MQDRDISGGTESLSSHQRSLNLDNVRSHDVPRGPKSLYMQEGGSFESPFPYNRNSDPESSPFYLPGHDSGRDVPGMPKPSSSYPSFTAPQGSHASKEQPQHRRDDTRHPEGSKSAAGSDLGKFGRHPYQREMPSSSKTLLRSGKADDKRRASEDIPKSSEDVFLTADVDELNFVDPLGPDKGYADWEHRSV
jgi:hypothetical protein